MFAVLAILRTHLKFKIQDPFLIYITMCLNWRMCSLLMVKFSFVRHVEYLLAYNIALKLHRIYVEVGIILLYILLRSTR